MRKALGVLLCLLFVSGGFCTGNSGWVTICDEQTDGVLIHPHNAYCYNVTTTGNIDCNDALKLPEWLAWPTARVNCETLLNREHLVFKRVSLSTPMRLYSENRGVEVKGFMKCDSEVFNTPATNCKLGININDTILLLRALFFVGMAIISPVALFQRQISCEESITGKPVSRRALLGYRSVLFFIAFCAWWVNMIVFSLIDRMESSSTVFGSICIYSILNYAISCIFALFVLEESEFAKEKGLLHMKKYL